MQSFSGKLSAARHYGGISSLLLGLFLSAGCTTTWHIKGQSEIEERVAEAAPQVLLFSPIENDVYISISARYVPPEPGEKNVDLTEIACKKAGMLSKIKEQTAIIYAYVDQQELPIPIFGVSTVARAERRDCVRKMDEVVFLPRLLFDSDGLSVKVDLRHDNKDDISNDDVQEILSKVVTFASLATNGTLSIIPAAKLALERLNPDMSVNFRKENYAATNSFYVQWNDRITRQRTYRLPLIFNESGDQMLEAGFIEFRVTPRPTRFKNIPLYPGRGTPNYENRYLEDLADMASDQSTTSALKIMVLEFRRDLDYLATPSEIEERCKRFVTELNRFELNNYDGAFILYQALKHVKGFNEKEEATIFQCAKRFETAIRNSFPYWKSAESFKVLKEAEEKAADFGVIVQATLNRLAAGMFIPAEERLDFFRSVFAEEIEVENRGDFDFLESAGMGTAKQKVPLEKLVEMLKPLRGAGMGCYFDLNAGQRRLYIEDYSYLALYRDQDQDKGAHGGFMRILADIGRNEAGYYRINGLALDRVLPSDNERFTEWCGNGCSSRCNKFREPLP